MSGGVGGVTGAILLPPPDQYRAGVLWELGPRQLFDLNLGSHPSCIPQVIVDDRSEQSRPDRISDEYHPHCAMLDRESRAARSAQGAGAEHAVAGL